MSPEPWMDFNSRPASAKYRPWPVRIGPSRLVVLTGSSIAQYMYQMELEALKRAKLQLRDFQISCINESTTIV